MSPKAIVLACAAGMPILAAASQPARAVLCTLDDVPAATLLAPYFEVATGGGVTTLISINNVEAEAALAHVTFWTNWSLPTIDFDIYLTGYDVQTFDLADIFFLGNLPITADAAGDPNDAISPQGQCCAEDVAFPNCASLLPYYSNPTLNGFTIARLRNGHQGLPDPALGKCLGGNPGRNAWVGYITVDSVNACSPVFPGEPGYFIDGGLGIANDKNVLWGDYLILDTENHLIFGDRLVAVEADPTFGGGSTPTGYTFYGRYVHPSGADNREPLGTVWSARVFGWTTELIVWRDSTLSTIAAGGYDCSSGPPWLPLPQMQVYAFDEQEGCTEICLQSWEISPEPERKPCFPTETGRYDVANFPMPYAYGWLHLNLNIPGDAFTGDVDFGSTGVIAQSFVSEIHSSNFYYQVGLPAIELSSACLDANRRVDP